MLLSLGAQPSGSFTVGLTDANYINAPEQSGLYAGSGGYHIDADGSVNLKGGVIASTAPQIGNDLAADAINFSDLTTAPRRRASASAAA
jgi:filamentous hemagglutinin